MNFKRHCDNSMRQKSQNKIWMIQNVSLVIISRDSCLLTKCHWYTIDTHTSSMTDLNYTSAISRNERRLSIVIVHQRRVRHLYHCRRHVSLTFFRYEIFVSVFFCKDAFASKEKTTGDIFLWNLFALYHCSLLKFT